MGARLRWAWLTMFTIWASRSLQSNTLRLHSEGARAIDGAANDLGAASLLHRNRFARTMASSTELEPSSTTPSTGIFSPGFTRMRSPGWTSSRGTSLNAIGNPVGDGRREAQQSTDGARRLAAGAEFQNLAEQNKSAIAAAASKYTSG